MPDPNFQPKTTVLHTEGGTFDACSGTYELTHVTRPFRPTFVSADTDPRGLAGSIFREWEQGNPSELLAMGKDAVYKAIIAIPQANGMVAPLGVQFLTSIQWSKVAVDAFAGAKKSPGHHLMGEQTYKVFEADKKTLFIDRTKNAVQLVTAGPDEAMRQWQSHPEYADATARGAILLAVKTAVSIRLIPVRRGGAA